MPVNKVLSRSTLVGIGVVVALVCVVAYFGYGAVGRAAGPPTEKEVGNLIKETYDTCVLKEEWNKKLGGLRVLCSASPEVTEPLRSCISDCRSTYEPGYNDYFKCTASCQATADKGQAACNEKKVQEEKQWEEWKKDKTQCDEYRKVAADHFVSFKKTDGKLNRQDAYQEAEEYDMFGIVTIFNSATGKEEGHDVRFRFERRESGWVTRSSIFGADGPALKIPR